MISGAPSQDSLLPDNRHAADYQQLREQLIQEPLLIQNSSYMKRATLIGPARIP